MRKVRLGQADVAGTARSRGRDGLMDGALVRRVVSGCATGFVLMDSVYVKPDGYRSHLLIGLTLTREHGRWLVILDQNTRIPAV